MWSPLGWRNLLQDIFRVSKICVHKNVWGKARSVENSIKRSYTNRRENPLMVQQKLILKFTVLFSTIKFGAYFHFPFYLTLFVAY